MDITPASTLTALIAELDSYGGHESFRRDILVALGLPTDAQPGDVLDVADLRAAYVDRGDEVLSVYAVVGGGLVLHQRTSDNSSRLTLAVPASRIARTSLRCDDDMMTVVVEYDADVTTTVADGEFLEGPGAEDGVRAGRTRQESTTRRAGYVLTGEVGDAALEALHASIQALLLRG